MPKKRDSTLTSHEQVRPHRASFAAFGTVEHVLDQAALQVPVLFPDLAPRFLPHLQDLVTRYAHLQHWTKVALTLCRGLASETLDNLLSSHTAHHGLLVIDPIGTSPEYQTYDNYTQVRAAQDRLVRVNKATDDVMIVLFGIDNPDATMVSTLIMWRLRMVMASLKLIAKPDLLDKQRAASPARALLLSDTMRRLMMACTLLGVSAHALSEDMLNRFDPDGNRIAGSLFHAVHNLRGIEGMPFDPQMDADLASITYVLQMLYPSVAPLLEQVPDFGLPGFDQALQSLPSSKALSGAYAMPVQATVGREGADVFLPEPAAPAPH